MQRRREPAVRVVQAYQALVQRWLLSAGDGRVPLPLRLHGRPPLLRDLAARAVGLGVWPTRLDGVGAQPFGVQSSSMLPSGS